MQSALAALVVTGCAREPVPREPEPVVVSPSAEVRMRVVERRHERALRLKESGDLAGAEVEWQVLTLMEPENATFRRELSAVRSVIARSVEENLRAGNAALKRGDSDAAAASMLKVLALAPDNAEAARVLRDIEKQRTVKFHADRVARLRPEDYNAYIAVPRLRARAAEPQPAADPNRAYDLDQSLEIFRAGDTEGGLAGLRRYAVAYPNDRAGRQQAGTAVAERAQQLDAEGKREAAVALYDQAILLYGRSPPPGWDARSRALKKSLAAESYENGVKAYRTDLAAAIRYWETTLQYEPGHTGAALKLQEARRMQTRLQRIDQEKAKP